MVGSARTVSQIRQQPGTQGLLSWRRRQLLIAFLFILPALINFTIFRYIPILASIRASVYQYSLLGGYKDFIGLDHYARMLGDATFWQSLKVTALFVIYKVPIQIVLSLALAVSRGLRTSRTRLSRSLADFSTSLRSRRQSTVNR
jgi:ABC-type sugar transport system permease subunit